MKQKKHYIHSYFTQQIHKTTIIVVGCGGTGSLFLTRLARLNYALIKSGLTGFHVYVYDGDKVTENNVGRQQFSVSDIGRNKAIASVEKINLAYEFGWEARPYAYEEKFALANILVTCVDNTETRKKINNQMIGDYDRLPNKAHDKTFFYWLDMGNGKDFGQVVLGSKKITQKKTKKSHALLTVFEYFGDLSQYEDKQPLSCSYIESLNYQSLFINDMIAVYGIIMLHDLFIHGYITYNGIMINNIEKKVQILPL